MKRCIHDRWRLNYRISLKVCFIFLQTRQPGHHFHGRVTVFPASCAGFPLLVLPFVYLDGSKLVGFLLAEVEETGNGDPIRQEIDEGDIIDQVVRLSDAQY